MNNNIQHLWAIHIANSTLHIPKILNLSPPPAKNQPIKLSIPIIAYISSHPSSNPPSNNLTEKKLLNRIRKWKNKSLPWIKKWNKLSAPTAKKKNMGSIWIKAWIPKCRNRKMRCRNWKVGSARWRKKYFKSRKKISTPMTNRLLSKNKTLLKFWKMISRNLRTRKMDWSRCGRNRKKPSISSKTTTAITRKYKNQEPNC